MGKIVTVLLAGGAGKRLWPIHKNDYPKQFMSVDGKPLICNAIERAKVISEELVVVTSELHYHKVKNLVYKEFTPKNAYFLLEPIGKNTAPAIALAVNFIKKHPMRKKKSLGHTKYN